MASGLLEQAETKGNAMTRSLEVLSEVIRDPKPSFRQIEDRPAKAKKHRYERRKIRELIRQGEWTEEEQM